MKIFLKGSPSLDLLLSTNKVIQQLNKSLSKQWVTCPLVFKHWNWVILCQISDESSSCCEHEVECIKSNAILRSYNYFTNDSQHLLNIYWMLDRVLITSLSLSILITIPWDCWSVIPTKQRREVKGLVSITG